MAGAGAAIGGLAGGASIAIPEHQIGLLAAAAVGGFGTAAGNLLNDLMDRELDRHAHPERPLPQGVLRPPAVWVTLIALFILAVGLATWFNPVAGALALLLVALLVLYDTRLKHRGLPGNVAVALAAGALFPMGALIAPTSNMLAPLLLGSLAALAHLGRELLKDLEDAKADRGHRRTFAHKNAQLASGIASATFVVAAALSPLPYLLLLWHWSYLVVVAPAALLLVAAGLVGRRKPGHGQQLAKLGMMIALVAFLVGAHV